MTTFQIDTDDKRAIDEIKNFIVHNFSFEIKIKKDKQTKWQDFAKKVDGIFTPNIISHINTSRKEARDSFIKKD